MDMLIEAGDYIIEHNLFSKMGIPGWAVPRIKETWESEPPMLYGRFDFAYGPDGAKLLEYNADTPTALLETAVQWHWVQDVFGPSGDQWNTVHEALVTRWRELNEADRLPGQWVHMLHTTAEGSGEDFMTIGYMAATAHEAGIRVELMPIENIGYNDEQGFLDMQGRYVRTAFKLYPWEWIVHEHFSSAALDRMGDEPGQTTWIEPIWKMMWSNKGILPVLWELYPEHETPAARLVRGRGAQGPRVLRAQAPAGARGSRLGGGGRRQGRRAGAGTGLRRRRDSSCSSTPTWASTRAGSARCSACGRSTWSPWAVGFASSTG